MIKPEILCRYTDRWKTGDSLDLRLHATPPPLFHFRKNFKKINDQIFRTNGLFYDDYLFILT